MVVRSPPVGSFYFLTILYHRENHCGENNWSSLCKMGSEASFCGKVQRKSVFLQPFSLLRNKRLIRGRWPNSGIGHFQLGTAKLGFGKSLIAASLSALAAGVRSNSFNYLSSYYYHY